MDFNSVIPISYLYAYMIKEFPPYGFFVGQVVKNRGAAADGKVHRVLYEDGDSEDLSSGEIEDLLTLNGQVQPGSISSYHEQIRLIKEREAEKAMKRQR